VPNTSLRALSTTSSSQSPVGTASQAAGVGNATGKLGENGKEKRYEVPEMTPYQSALQAGTEGSPFSQASKASSKAQSPRQLTESVEQTNATSKNQTSTEDLVQSFDQLESLLEEESNGSSGSASAKKDGQPEVYVNPITGEVNGPRGPEPTRYGDFERAGRCFDF